MAYHTQSSGYQRKKAQHWPEKEEVKPEQHTRPKVGAWKPQASYQTLYSPLSTSPVINAWSSSEDISAVSNSGVTESGVLTHSESQVSVASQISEDGMYSDVKQMVKNIEEKLNVMQIDSREEASKKKKLERKCAEQGNKIQDLEKELKHRNITIEGLSETCQKVTSALQKAKKELMKMKEENEKLKTFVQKQYPNVLDLFQNFYTTSPNDTNAKLTALHGAFSDVMHIVPVPLTPQQRVPSVLKPNIVSVRSPLQQRAQSPPKPTKVTTPHREDGPEYHTNTENSV